MKLVKHYLKLSDLMRDHPALDLEAAMQKDAFDDIPSSYNLAEIEWVKCQLDIDGKICREPHGIGWVMTRKNDGVQGFIGGHCANEHLLSNVDFANAAAKARRDVRLQRLVARLAPLIAERDVLRQRITDVFGRQQELRRLVARIRESLPFPVLESLHDMVKTGNRGLRVEFRHVEKDEDRDGNPIDVVRWRSDQVANIAAPAAVEIVVVNDIGDRLRVGLEACNHAEASTERTEKELRAWAEAIEAIDRCESDLEEATTALSAFVDLQNLRGLCWVCRKDEDQVQTAQAAMRLTGRNADERAARKSRDEWRQEIRTSHGGLDFRIL